MKTTREGRRGGRIREEGLKEDKKTTGGAAMVSERRKKRATVEVFPLIKRK